MEMPRTIRNRLNDRPLASAVAGGVLLVLGAVPGLAEPPAAPAAAGMRIHRDPETGAFVPPPPGSSAIGRDVVPAPAMQERVGLSPGGGTLLDGIPKMGVSVTVDAKGAVATRCERTPAEAR
jgi:hypothetical protein